MSSTRLENAGVRVYSKRTLESISTHQPPHTIHETMKKIKRIVRDVPQHWVGDGFPVRSLFTYEDAAEFDPFLLLDYAGPHEFAPSESKRGVGEHPHRGFETVTILYQGELEHRDSAGGHGAIGPGDVQWMTAASGIVHEEFHGRRFTETGGTLEMVQLWVNLPAEAKSSAPKYQDLRDSDFPRVSLPNDSGTARLIAGELLGARGPAETFTEINLWDLSLHAEATFVAPVPEGHTALVVVQHGSLHLNTEPIKAMELALFEQQGELIEIDAKAESRILVLSGKPLHEPVAARGPFVMNTREEIQQAIHDYQAGKMGTLSDRTSA